MPDPTSTLFPYTTLFRSRAHQLQRAPETGGRHRQAGRVKRWGLPPRVPDHLSRRSLDEAHGDDVPESHGDGRDRKSTRLNSSHTVISYAVFCLKKKTNRA